MFRKITARAAGKVALRSPTTPACATAAAITAAMTTSNPVVASRRFCSDKPKTDAEAAKKEEGTMAPTDSPRVVSEPTAFPDFTVESLLARIRKSPGVTGASLSPQAACQRTDSAFTALTASDVIEVRVLPGRRPAEVLFPLTATAGPSRKAFVEALRACVEGNTVLVVAVACYYFADGPGWKMWFRKYVWFDGADQGHFKFFQDTCAQTGVDESAFFFAVNMGKDESICAQCQALLDRLTSCLEPVTFQKPLSEVLNDKGIIWLLNKRSKVLMRDEYLPSGELRATWKDTEKELATYWLLDNDLKIERNSSTIFTHLAMTDQIREARVNDGTVVVVGGASGTGKTCTLLSVGTSKELHIAVSMGKLVADFTPKKAALGTRPTQEEDIEDFAQYIRKKIRDRLEDALAKTTNNEVKGNVVNVVLHVDEAGMALCSYARRVIVMPRPQMRLLIHAQERLARPTLVEGPPSVWLTVRVAIAGTGLEGLYNGTEGSIAGKFRVVALTRSTASAVEFDALTEKIVKAHLAMSTVPTEALDDVVRVVMRRPEIARVAATNYRLLSYCLLQLVDLVESQWKFERTSPGDSVCDVYKKALYCEGVDVPLRRCYDAALPYACMQGAKNFIKVNGLCNLSRRTVRLVIRVAHVAYLRRAVVVPAEEMITVGAELTRHGFTPVASDTTFAELLEVAAAAGVFTWSKMECDARQPPGDFIAAGTAKEAAKGTFVGIPRSDASVQLSPAYVMLPRLLDGTLFTDGSPGAFESVASALLCRSLHALGLVRGGCDRWELYAAMCGPEYVLHLHQHSATVPPDNTFIFFTRAVEVDLGVQLRPGVTEMTILLQCAHALREMLLQDEVSTDALDAAIHESNRDKLLAQVANVMFVINPAGQSPSPDAVLLCVGSAGKRGYLTVRQDKREQKPFDDKRVAHEVDKCRDTLDMLEALATGKGPDVKMEEFFFNLNTQSNTRESYELKRGKKKESRTLRIHSCVRSDAFFLSSGKV